MKWKKPKQIKIKSFHGLVNFLLSNLSKQNCVEHAGKLFYCAIQIGKFLPERIFVCLSVGGYTAVKKNMCFFLIYIEGLVLWDASTVKKTHL